MLGRLQESYLVRIVTPLESPFDHLSQVFDRWSLNIRQAERHFRSLHIAAHGMHDREVFIRECGNFDEQGVDASFTLGGSESELMSLRCFGSVRA